MSVSTSMTVVFRTKRVWKPNVHWKTFHSELLGHSFQVPPPLPTRISYPFGLSLSLSLPFTPFLIYFLYSLVFL